ncbi:helix-turn-helix transcriptional regulator [Roseibacillus persicicus]|uniref:helix-turn-helix transcriptional regulator n=1 Tax=Roseibacillus persicicus TaxID=454148 RepID=UPI00398A7997
MTKGQLPAEGFVRLEQVLEVIPVSKSTWFRGIQAGRFPKPIKLGARASAWRVEDIRGLIQSKFE